MAKAPMAPEDTDTPEEEASELTPLGKRTLQGFVAKWGPDRGPLKFEQAMTNGTIDRAKMEKEPASEPDDKMPAPRGKK